MPPPDWTIAVSIAKDSHNWTNLFGPSHKINLLALYSVIFTSIIVVFFYILLTGAGKSMACRCCAN